jgi:peptidyl-prolyl cis-trans isomerase C
MMAVKTVRYYEYNVKLKMRDITIGILLSIVVLMGAFIAQREFGTSELLGVAPATHAVPTPASLGATQLLPLRVNDNSIPVAELQIMLRDRGIAESAAEAQLLTEMQARLINRELYSQAARAAKLDKDAAVATRMRMAAEDVLAGEYRAAFLRNNPVTDATVRAVYDDLVTRGGDVEYRVSQIFVADEPAALMVMSRLNEGATSFAELAKRFSKDDASREQGGDLGWLSALVIQPEFLQTVRSLEPAEYSIPIRGSNGWHILYLAETRPFALRSYDELAGEIRASLQQAVIDTHLNELRANAQIDTNNPEFKLP